MIFARVWTHRCRLVRFLHFWRRYGGMPRETGCALMRLLRTWSRRMGLGCMPICTVGKATKGMLDTGIGAREGLTRGTRLTRSGRKLSASCCYTLSPVRAAVVRLWTAVFRGRTSPKPDLPIHRKQIEHFGRN